MGGVTIARLDRTSVAAGWTLVGAIIVAIALVSVGSALGATIYDMPVALAFGLSLVHAATIPFALRRPFTAGLISAAAVTGLAFAQSTTLGAPWPWAVTTLVTQAIVLSLVGLQARGRIGVLVWLLAAGGSVIAAVYYPRGTDGATINVIIATTVTGIALSAGVIAREWRRVTTLLLRERAVSADEHEHRVLAEEKARIARELHDVVAHSMSVINVQASSAVYRHPDVPAPVAREFEEIAAAARGAIVELRGVLGVLRSEGAEQELAPQPRFGDIPTLVDSTTLPGVDVSLEFDDQLASAPVSDLTGLAAYRVVQEALSNALRHAPGASIRVTCLRSQNWLVVTVMNTEATREAMQGEAGLGLIGMRERVLAVQGTMTAGPTPDGGFAVVARLPLKVQ